MCVEAKARPMAKGFSLHRTWCVHLFFTLDNHVISQSCFDRASLFVDFSWKGKINIHMGHTHTRTHLCDLSIGNKPSKYKCMWNRFGLDHVINGLTRNLEDFLEHERHLNQLYKIASQKISREIHFMSPIPSTKYRVVYAHKLFILLTFKSITRTNAHTYSVCRKKKLCDYDSGPLSKRRKI